MFSHLLNRHDDYCNLLSTLVIGGPNPIKIKGLLFKLSDMVYYC